MPDNTNVNNNASVVVVGRTAPVPPGQQKSDKSVPVVIASDQSTIPVAEQNKVQSEVALSLLGIPRSEVALGIFADVNTYDVNPTEWAAQPEAFEKVSNTGTYAGAEGIMNWGLSHVPQESGALVEAPPDRTAILTSKRFFRYQPGRVSAATFGVKTTIMDTTSTDTSATADTQDIGSTVYNPAIRKYGIFDNFDGYYWETRNNGQGDNFCVVRRTQSLLFNNPVTFSATGGQTEDFGATNPLDVFKARGNETKDDKVIGGVGQPRGYISGNYPNDHDSTPDGFENVKLGDLIIYRDNLMMTHAGVYDPSLLQEKQEYSFTTDVSEEELIFDVSATSGVTGIGKSIIGADYDISSGIMTVTTAAPHGFVAGKFVNLIGIAMTCQYSYSDYVGGANGGTLVPGQIKRYPDRTHGHSIIRVDATNKFVVNVGVSTVPTFFHLEATKGNVVGYAGTGAAVLGLSTSQYVSYENASSGNVINGLTDQKIYRVNRIVYDYETEKAKVQLKELSQPLSTVVSKDGSKDIGAPQTAVNLGGSDSSASGHKLITPVPFVQPVTAGIIPNANPYNSLKRSGMFPYMYKNSDETVKEGYIDTTLPVSSAADIALQISNVNAYYENWINQNVKPEFWNVYEYRVPRSRFSGDRLDNTTDDLLYSDVTATNRAGSNVLDPTTGEITTDTSIWNLEFDKVTMYKVEFSWYGAVGALFLAYVPVGAGEARWVRVHHLRASNQLKGSSLGNATLPITYLVYGGGGPNRFGYANSKRTKNDNDDYGSPSEHIIKYGASYYIDGGDRGTVKLFSHGTQTAQDVFGSRRTFVVGTASTHIERDVANMTSDTDPYLTGKTAVGFTSSYYVGAKVFTGNVLDQNIEVVYVDTDNNRLHLNMPLAAAPANASTIDIIVNRPKPLIGLKCRDFIVSSQGREVRNRTQVYPTRLSTGSEGSVIKVDLLKTPIFQTTSTISGATPTLSSSANIGKRSEPTLISVSNSSYLAEGTGVYGYFRGKFEGDSSNKVITVLGYLERRLSTSPTPGYYFNALESTTASIILDANSKFLYEGQLSPEGNGVTASNSDFTLDALSSIKVANPLTRAPIPKTGTIVASLFIPASGEEFDLSSYFDYNKEYLSFPLTNVVESLFVVGSSDKLFSDTAISSTSASITWEEQ